MRGLGTDHVISGPMRGLEKNCIPWRRHTAKQTAQVGRFSENLDKVSGITVCFVRRFEIFDFYKYLKAAKI